MKELSRTAAAVQASATMAIDTLFKQMKADGVDVIGFGAGEPDFSTPDHIKEAGIRAIQNNDTKYTPSTGTVELRKAICSRLKKDWGLEYDVKQVAVSNGAKPCVFVSLCVLLNPGDEVILPAPFWVSYSEMVQMAGGVPVIIETREQDQFKLSAEELRAAITPKTKCMILNNPSNPTGMMYSRSELESIAKVCVEEDIYVISDEIYCDLVYDKAEYVSLPSLGQEIKDRTLLVNGVSKSYAMTGWRIGYVAASQKIATLIANYLSHATGSPSAISQKAALEALSSDKKEIDSMRKAFQRRRSYMVERMNTIPNVSCTMPQGAFYVLMNIEKLIGKELHGVTIRTADEFASLFLQYGKVAVVPGTSFHAPNYVRWSYATSIENIREGLNRLEKFLAGETI